MICATFYLHEGKEEDIFLFFPTFCYNCETFSDCYIRIQPCSYQSSLKKDITWVISKLNGPQVSFISLLFIASQVSSNDGGVIGSLPSVLCEAKSTATQLSSSIHSSVKASLAFKAAPLLLILHRDQRFKKKPQFKVLIAAKQISRPHFSGRNGSLDVWLLSAPTHVQSGRCHWWNYQKRWFTEYTKGRDANGQHWKKIIQRWWFVLAFSRAVL